METNPLHLPLEARAELWQQIIAAIETYLAGIDELPIAPHLEPNRSRHLLARVNFHQPLPPGQAVDLVVEGLTHHQIHTAHRRYFGLFNPTPATMGIAADALVAAFNPQLAAWGHNPFAVETEMHLIRALASRFGYPAEGVDGTFCSGGAEANHTAVLAALTYSFPAFDQEGLRSLEAQPVLYVSEESHHSFVKAARACGLGTRAIRHVPVDPALRMDQGALEGLLAADRAAGLAPFLLVGTAGTTSAGVIDLLPSLAQVAAREHLWFHVDAAWGGAAALVPELRPLLDGIERADSLTFDAHKWLSVPMAAGIFLTRHPEILDRTFHIQTAYVPPDGAALDIVDPYTHSMQWSRRFIGLKVFLSLAVAGWSGYVAALRQQTAMGKLLRQKLEAAGWEILNQTDLPVVCFADGRHPEGRLAPYLQSACQSLVEAGRAWVSFTVLNGTIPALRACITSIRTTPEDLDILIEELESARQKA